MTRILPTFAVLLALASVGCQSPAAPTPTLEAAKTIAVAKTPHGLGAAKGFVYAGAIEAEAISVIDTRTDTLTKTLSVPGGQVVFITAFPDGEHVLALDNRRGEVLVIDPARDHAVIQTIAVGEGPDEAFFGLDGSVIVSLADEDRLVRLSFQDDRALPPARESFPIGTAAGASDRHRPLAHAAGWAIAPNTGDNDVSLTELSTGRTLRLADGNNPGPVGIASWDGAARMALVGYRASHTVALYDLPTGAVTKLTDVGQFPQAMALDPTARRAYVVMSGSNELASIDLATKSPRGRVKLGSRPVEIKLAPGLSGGGLEAWVGNDGSDSVSVVDTERLAIKATVGVGKGHHHLAIWEHKAYVSNLEDGTVSVIDRAMLP